MKKFSAECTYHERSLSKVKYKHSVCTVLITSMTYARVGDDLNIFTDM